jgi:hypothetical protein
MKLSMKGSLIKLCLQRYDEINFLLRTWLAIQADASNLLFL